MAFLQSRKGIDITIVIIIIVAILIAMAVIAAALRGIISIGGTSDIANCRSCVQIQGCFGVSPGGTATFPAACSTLCSKVGITAVPADIHC